MVGQLVGAQSAAINFSAVHYIHDGRGYLITLNYCSNLNH